MANRFLHTNRTHLCAAFLVLVTVPGIAHSAPKMVRTSNDGIYMEANQWYARQRIAHLFTEGILNTTDTVNAGKPMQLPAQYRAKPNLGKQVAKLARTLTPIGIGAELLNYMLENTPAQVHPTEDRFIKDQEPENLEQWMCTYNCWAGSGPFPSATQLCQQSMAARNSKANTPGFGAETYNYIGHRFNGNQVICKSNVIPGNYETELFNGTRSTSTPNPNYGDVIDLDPSDWEEIENDPNLPQLNDQQLNELKERDPIGVPVEAPTFPSLPETRPLTDAYQKPGPAGAPGTGDWEQVIVRLIPGPQGKVGVETKIVPVTGPQGIEDPTTPYDPNRPEQEVDNSPNVNEDGSIDVRIVGGDVTVNVEFCEEGDTRLMCTHLGEPPEGEIPSDDFELSFDHAPVVFTEGACPEGPTANTPWGSVYFDMYWPCEFATAIKPIVLAVGMFVAVYIFVGGLRTE